MRKTYCSDGTVSLAEYLPESDNADQYACWHDPAVERGYNFRMTATFDEFCISGMKSAFIATLLRTSDGVPIGFVSLSQDSPPDLAINLYAVCRGAGLGTRAFALAADYCMNVLGHAAITAGCYEGNDASMQMLEKCGFVRNPSGDCAAPHYLTGEPVMQLDFIKYR